MNSGCTRWVHAPSTNLGGPSSGHRGPVSGPGTQTSELWRASGSEPRSPLPKSSASLLFLTLFLPSLPRSSFASCFSTWPVTVILREAVLWLSLLRRHLRRISRKGEVTLQKLNEERWLTELRRASTTVAEGTRKDLLKASSGVSSMLPVYQKAHQRRLKKMMMEPR